MKLTFLQSSSYILEHNGVKILNDPWLVDGEYYGSWAHYPPFDFNPNDYSDIDYVFISHIHPDHISLKTLNQLNKDIPVLIHKFQTKFLKKNIENLGFSTIEIEHNQRTKLKDDLYINILAADNCNPELCGKFLGCGTAENKFKEMYFDSICVVDNNTEVVVNINDCPYELAQATLSLILEKYKKIDLLLVGYAGAGPFPQCFEMDDKSKINFAEKKRLQFLTQAEKFINLFKPEYFMPFAGRYVLSGKLSNLNSFRGVPELEDAFDYFNDSQNIPTKSKSILLNPGSSFDISTGVTSKSYSPISKQEKNDFIKNVLSLRKLDYEYSTFPEFEELASLIPKCFSRFENKRKEIGFSTETRILLELSDTKFVEIPCNGESFKIITKEESKNITKYVKMYLDYRLLKSVLQGPKYAHWNNADIGSHIRYSRSSDIFERGLSYCMNFFHA